MYLLFDQFSFNCKFMFGGGGGFHTLEKMCYVKINLGLNMLLDVRLT